MKLEGIQDYLEAEDVGETGVDLFINHMDDEVKEGVVLMSPLTGTYIDHELPNYRKGSFQVIVRARDYESGDELARTISDLLTLENTRTTIDDMAIKYMRPKHEPIVFPRLQGGGLEFSVNFEVAYVII